MASVVGYERTYRPSGRLPRSTRSSPSPVRSDAAGSVASLAALVEREVLPRLLLAHGVSEGTATENHDVVMLEEVEAFTTRTLADQAGILLAEVERLLARGVTVDAVLVDLLAPAARLLGTWWEEDRCDFIQVTMGLWRLQEIVRELGAYGRPVAPHGGGRRTALFSPMPGEQHDFGTVMIGEMFQRHGWDAEVTVGASMSKLLDCVGGRYFDLVGLTLSCDCHTERVSSAILAIRSVSRNSRVRVMVGGRIFSENPKLAVELGADGTAADARQAVILAGALVDALSCELPSSC